MKRFVPVTLLLLAGCSATQPPPNADAPTRISQRGTVGAVPSDFAPGLRSAAAPEPTRRVIIINDTGPTRVTQEPAKPLKFDPRSLEIKQVAPQKARLRPRPRAIAAAVSDQGTEELTLSENMSPMQIIQAIADDIRNTEDEGKLAKLWLKLESAKNAAPTTDLIRRLNLLQQAVAAKQNLKKSSSSMAKRANENGINLYLSLAVEPEKTEEQKRAFKGQALQSIRSGFKPRR
jgi:hypothetical protein